MSMRRSLRASRSGARSVISTVLPQACHCGFKRTLGATLDVTGNSVGRRTCAENAMTSKVCINKGLKDLDGAQGRPPANVMGSFAMEYDIGKLKLLAQGRVRVGIRPLKILSLALK